MTPLKSPLAIFLMGITSAAASAAALGATEDAGDLATGPGRAAEMRLAQAGSEKQPGGVELRPSGAESAKPMAPAPTAPGMAPPPPAAAPATAPPPPPAKSDDKMQDEPKTRSLKTRASPPDAGGMPLGTSSGGDERRPGGVERAPTRE